MLTRYSKTLCAFAILAMGAMAFVSCNGKSETQGDGTEKDSKYNQQLVISELMPDNQTTVLSPESVPADWIEIENISNSKVSLKGYALMVEAGSKKTKQKATDGEKKDSLSTQDSTKNATAKPEADKANQAKNDSVGKKSVRWEFPDLDLAAGERIVVFTGKQKGEEATADKNTTKSLTANIKLPSKNAQVKLLTPMGNILSDASYSALNADQSMARNAEGKLVVCNTPTPGFANNLEGIQAFLKDRYQAPAQGLLIWEINSKGSALENQWVELKNTSSATINLKDYALTNDFSKPSKSPLPDVQLAPGEFYTVKTVGKKLANAKPGMATFKLGDDECAILTKDGKYIDGINGHGTIMGTSRGRIAAQPGVYFFDTTTAGAENAQKGYLSVAQQPALSKTPGVYEEKSMSVEINSNGQKVHYTLDGSLPTQASPVYTNAIALDKSTTIRYYSEGDAQNMRSEVYTSTFILGQKHSLPVLHLTVRHGDLFDPWDGIYVEGSRPPRYVTKKKANGGESRKNRNANYLQHWAKVAHAEFFDGKEGFSVGCAVKIFGAGSRHLTKKSMSLKFDSQYGPASVTYDFFNEGKPVELQDVVLRSGSSDQHGVMLRDEFFSSLMQPECPTMLSQAYRPIVLYVNGENWGVFYFREKIDNNFVARHLGVSNDNITIVRAEKAEIGSAAGLNEVHQYIRTNDMKQPAAFDYVNSKICCESLIDQKIGQMFSGNTDIYNVREVKSSDKGADNRWYWVYYDVDNTWETFKPMGFYLRSSYSNGIGSQPVAFCNLIMDKMMVNPQFRQLFLERLSHHMHVTFDYDHMIKKFDQMVADIKPEMPANCQKWPGLTYENWEKKVQIFRNKFADRRKFVLESTKQEIGVTAEENAKYFGDL